MGSLLERPTVKKDFDPKYSIILKQLEDEMDDTKKIFDQQNKLKKEKNQIQLHRNLPAISGSLKWCQELRDKIQKPMTNFDKLIDHPIKKTEAMSRVQKKYDELNALLTSFMVQPFQEWCSHVGTLSNNNLEKNLLLRDAKTKSIKTNFDPQVKKKFLIVFLRFFLNFFEF